MGVDTEYDAFISYSHAADGRLAPELQRGLQRLAKRPFQRRALRVFRDETGLSTNPHLWGSIADALLAAEWFVLLASPEAAASAWVNREVATWLASKPLERLLIVVTAGELHFSDAGIDADTTSCLPPSLVEALDEEPRWLDLRWCHHDEQLDLRNGRFRAALADLAAPMHGVPKEDLEGEDVRQQRRARRAAIAGVAVITVLTAISTVAAVAAVRQRNTAEEQRAEAESERTRAEDERARADEAAVRATSRALAAQAVATAPTDVQLALLLGVEGYHLDPSLDTETGLLTALDGARTVTSVVDGLPDGLVDFEITDDGSTMYYATSAGDVWVIDTSGWTVDDRPLVSGQRGMWVIGLSADGRRLAVGSGDGVDVYDTANGSVIAEDLIDTTPGAVSFDASGTRVAISEVDTPGLTVFDLATGVGLAFIEQADLGVFLPGDRIAVTSLGSPVVAIVDLFGDLSKPLVERTDLPPGGGLSLSPDGALLVTAGLSGEGQLLDASTLESVGAPLQVRGSRVADLGFSADGSLLMLSSDDGSVNVYATADGQLRSQLTGFTGTLIAGFLDNTRLVATSMFDGTTVEFDVAERTQLGSTTTIGPGIVGVFDVDDVSQLVMLQEGQLVVAPADAPLEPTITQRIGTIGRAVDVVETPSGAFVATYGLEIDEVAEEVSARTVSVWRLPSLEQVAAVEFGEVAVEQVALSPDATLLAVGQRDGALTVIDVSTGNRVVDAMPVDSLPCCLGLVVWSPSGDRLYTGGQDGTLRVWDTANWSLIAEQVLSPDQSALRLGHFNTDGSTLVVPSESGAVYLVDPATGAPKGAPFTAAGTQLQNAVLAQGDTVVAAVSRDGSLRLWDVASRRSIGPALRGHFEFAIALDPLSPSRLMTGGAVDGTLIEWTLEPDDWAATACELAGRNLTREEWSTYVGGEYRTTCEQWPAGV
jgi:WD40 repeat protein